MSDNALPAISDADAPVDRHSAIDMLERAMLAVAPVVGEPVCPLRHVFTPGLYTRQITMPAGALITSKIHRLRHPFEVSKGRVLVMLDDEWQEIVAPYLGVTEPGTRRVLYVLEETVWTTFHVNPDDGEDLAAIEARIIDKHQDHWHDELAQAMAERVKLLAAQPEDET